MTFKIKWGVLGNATIARKCVIPAIFNSANGHIHALASQNPQKAEAIAKEYNIPHLYTQYESVLNDQQIDAVYIPLPNHLHRQWTIRALEAGKHVLCEKPLKRWIHADGSKLSMKDSIKIMGQLGQIAWVLR